MGRLWNIQIVYVDDLHIVVVGPDKYVVLWMILVAYELLGTPFSYKKFHGGVECEFVGYWLSYRECCWDFFEEDAMGHGLDRQC